MIPYLTAQPLVLASASPRRLALLRQIGLEPQLAPADIEELASLDQHSPAQLAEVNAQQKALAVRDDFRQTAAIILAADTVVVKDGHLFGKPADHQQAAAMLRQLSGHSHQVYTGICLLRAADSKLICSSNCTEVNFSQLTEEQIAAYLATGEPFDKAGAYGIQGAAGLFVESIVGDYNTVVGLSLALLGRLAEQLSRC